MEPKECPEDMVWNPHRQKCTFPLDTEKTYYHGTSSNRARNIMQNGFSVPPSVPGIWITDNRREAEEYCIMANEDEGIKYEIGECEGILSIRLKPGVLERGVENVDVFYGEIVVGPEDITIIGMDED